VSGVRLPWLFDIRQRKFAYFSVMRWCRITGRLFLGCVVVVVVRRRVLGYRSSTAVDFPGHVLPGDATLEPIVSPWDVAPMAVILTEAGGRFTDIGGELSIWSGTGLATGGDLRDAGVGLVAGR